MKKTAATNSTAGRALRSEEGVGSDALGAMSCLYQQSPRQQSKIRAAGFPKTKSRHAREKGRNGKRLPVCGRRFPQGLFLFLRPASLVFPLFLPQGLVPFFLEHVALLGKA